MKNIEFDIFIMRLRDIFNENIAKPLMIELKK